ncbi:MAG: ribonuclease activity regulator RraA [Pseudomonadota bacterium]
MEPAATPNPSLVLDPQVAAVLRTVSTATITTVLFKKGLRNVWMRGPRPLAAGQLRTVGRAFTMRFVPAREDLSSPQAWSSPRSTRVAIEDMPEGSFVVADAMGVTDAGILGDILCARMARRGVVGLVTDGVIRDIAGVLSTGLPVWSQGTAAPAAVNSLTFVNWQDPVACGGVAVFPGEIVVADDDGAVLIPDAYLDDVLAAGTDQEQLEAWILDEVKGGAPLLGLYPPNADSLARYEKQRKS